MQALNEIETRRGLDCALLALYRQQVRSGFVLVDPRAADGKEEKEIRDPDTGVTFRLQWNPSRELRSNRELLIRRNIIAESVDERLLINRTERGMPCFLCPHNIALQNPGEILLPLRLVTEQFYAGANFASICDDHFTVMNARHRDPESLMPSQRYRSEIPLLLAEFTDQTMGTFRIIFNGRAGASIPEHEHFQITSEEFPIEVIGRNSSYAVKEEKGVTISHVPYYVPLQLVEGEGKERVAATVDGLIHAWRETDVARRTVNIIAAKNGKRYRFFIFLRNTTRLGNEINEKKGALGAFEMGGILVLSHEPENPDAPVNERRTFDTARLETVKKILGSAVPPGVCHYSE